MIAVAMTYLQDGLIGHDADKVLLAPEARRISNGKVVCQGRDAIRAIFPHEPVGAWHNLRWVVDGEDAVVVYDMLVDWTRADQSETFSDPSTWTLVFIGERFHIVDGLITEIEVLHALGEGCEPLQRPARTPPPADPPPPRDDVIALCQKYVHSLLTGDGDSVPLAPDAWRIENGHDVGDSGPRIQEMLTAMGAGEHTMILGIDDLRWYVDGEEAVAIYRLELDAAALGLETPGPVQLPVMERFRVHDGLITEVEPVFPALEAVAGG